MATLFSWDSGTLPALHGGGAMTLDNAVGFPTAPSIQIAQAASQASAALFSITARSTLAVRAYIQMPAPGSASAVLITSQVGSGDPSARFAIGGTGAPGQARLVKAGATLAQSANGLMTTGDWYRVELLHDGVNGRARTAVFPIGSTTPLWDSGWITDAAFTTSAIDRSRVGSYTASPQLGTYHIDSILGSDDISQWIGPHPGDIPPSSPLFVTGPGGVAYPVEVVGVWNGSAVQPVTLLGEWDGSAVQPIE